MSVYNLKKNKKSHVQTAAQLKRISNIPINDWREPSPIMRDKNDKGFERDEYLFEDFR